MNSRSPAAAPPHPLHTHAPAPAAEAHAQMLGAASAARRAGSRRAAVEAACNVLRFALAMQERLDVPSGLRTLAG